MEEPRPFGREETFRPIRVDESIVLGLRDDGSPVSERLRSAHRMAVASAIMALLWGFGALSFLALVTGAGTWLYLRSAEPRSAWKWVALSSAILGLLGLAASVGLALR